MDTIDAHLSGFGDLDQQQIQSAPASQASVAGSRSASIVAPATKTTETVACAITRALLV